MGSPPHPWAACSNALPPFRVEFLPHIQSKPPLEQLVAISLHLIICHYKAEMCTSEVLDLKLLKHTEILRWNLSCFSRSLFSGLGFLAKEVASGLCSKLYVNQYALLATELWFSLFFNQPIMLSLALTWLWNMQRGWQSNLLQYYYLRTNGKNKQPGIFCKGTGRGLFTRSHISGKQLAVVLIMSCP